MTTLVAHFAGLVERGATPESLAESLRQGLADGRLSLDACAKDLDALRIQVQECGLQKAIEGLLIKSVLDDREVEFVRRARHRDERGRYATDSALNEAGAPADDGTPSFFKPERSTDARPYLQHAEGDHTLPWRDVTPRHA